MAREIDDVYKRKKYKLARYDGKKSMTDDYTGKRIFSGNAPDAIHKHPINKISDTDHVTPINVIKKRYKGLSQEQLKQLANSKHNLAVTNSQLNRSKGDLENHQVLLKAAFKGEPVDVKTGATMLAKEVESRTCMREQATGMYAENITAAVVTNTSQAVQKIGSVTQEAGKDFAYGATDALLDSVIPLTVEAATNLCKVAKGEKELKEAGKDIAKATVNIAVVGGTERVLFKALSNESMVQIAQVALIVKDSAIRYVNGEINEAEFMDEVGEKGANMVAGMIGGAVGEEIGEWIGLIVGSAAGPTGSFVGFVVGHYVGKFLGAMIASFACSSVFNTLRHLDDYKLKESQIRRLEASALSEIEKQREILKSIVKQEDEIWNATVNDAFEIILFLIPAIVCIVTSCPTYNSSIGYIFDFAKMFASIECE